MFWLVLIDNITQPRISWNERLWRNFLDQISLWIFGGDVVGNKYRKIQPFVGGTIPLVVVFFSSIKKGESCQTNNDLYIYSISPLNCRFLIFCFNFPAMMYYNLHCKPNKNRGNCKLEIHKTISKNKFTKNINSHLY